MSLFSNTNSGGNNSTGFSGVNSNVGGTNTVGTSAASSSLPTSSKKIGSGSLLRDLLESASNFPKSDGVSDLGSIQLTIPELQKKTNQLRRQTSKSPTSFTRAHYLLASSGISADDIETELNSLGTQEIQNQFYGGGFGGGFGGGYHGPKGGFGGGFGGGFDWDDNRGDVYTQQQSGDLHRVSDGNLDNYLDSKKDENILAAIELSLTSASKDFDSFVARNISIDWKVRKDELRKTFGIPTSASSRSPSSASNLGDDAFKKSSKGSFSWNQPDSYNYHLLSALTSKPSSTSYSSKQLTRDKFESHGQIVYQLNEARISEQFFPLAMSFEEVSKSNSDLKSRQVGDSWKILVNLTDEKTSKLNQEKKFSDAAYKNLIVRTSRSYLENQFYDYIDHFYNKDEDKNKLPPSNVNKVIHFINKVTKFEGKENSNTLLINGVPIWALIFYLLRSGLYYELNDIVAKNQSSFDKFDKNFPIYLKKYLHEGKNSLPVDLGERLQSEFNQQFQFINEDLVDTYDTYKFSVYKIIGKCDLIKKSLPRSINLSIEDWLWFHLSLINETEGESGNASSTSSTLIFETYTLDDLQKKVVLLGSKKFNASSNNPLYLKSLILTGLYELAVQYTYEYIDECDAVHLAIGLAYYGLLKTTTNIRGTNQDNLMIVNSEGEFEINFSRLLGSYTRTFKISDPKVACQYAILIAMEGGNNVEISHEAIRELILISREFSMLLGSINSLNGERLAGILENQRSLIGLQDLETFYQVIIEKLANRCEEEGRIFDSILLYQLAQEYNTVIVLLSKLLGEILSTTPLDQALLVEGVDTADNNVILLAKHILTTFKKNTHILDSISSTKKDSCDLLISIVEVRSSFLNKDWSLTLQKILNLEIIPIQAKLDLITIRKNAELVSNSLDESVIKVIPSLLIMIMTSISQLHYSILTQRYNTSGNQKEELERLHKMAKNCMVYAGMVQYKMPRETYSLLVNLEALL